MKKAVIALVLAPVLCVGSLAMLPVLLIGALCQGGAVTSTMSGYSPDAVPAQYRDAVAKAGAICDEITPALIAAQIEAESAWNPNAGSAAGARGIAQFMPGTWKSRGKDGDGDGKADILNPADAIYSQGHFMCDAYKDVSGWVSQGRVSLGEYDLIDLALAYYNAGPGSVLSAHGFPARIRETREYAKKIKSLAGKYGASSVSRSPNQAQPAPAPSPSPVGAEAAQGQVVSAPSGGWNGKFAPPKTGPLHVTSPFGMRIHPVFGVRKGHQGVDLQAPVGEAQYATAPGVVYKAGMVAGCGNWVRIKHGTFGGHEWSTTHCHLSLIETRVGAKVNTGDEIGKTGATGNVTGPHVHYQIEIDGNPVDPMPYIKGQVASPTGFVSGGASSSGAGGFLASLVCGFVGGASGPANNNLPGVVTDAHQEAILNRGRSVFGLPYVWGGGDNNGPTRGKRGAAVGFDCSGFVKYVVYQTLGVSLPHYAGDQYLATKSSTVTTDRSQVEALARPGDLVFFGSSLASRDTITHVAIYAGGGKIYHASQSRGQVLEAPLWKSNLLAVTRLQQGG